MFGSSHPGLCVVAAAIIPMATAITFGAQAQQNRDQIPDEYTWDLAAIYPSDAAWRAAKDTLAAEIPKVAQFAGMLSQSAARLADALDLVTELNKALARTFVYASMKSDQDTRVAGYQGMQQEMIQLATSFGAAAAFVEPEILKIDPAAITRFVASEPRLKVYSLYLDDIQRRRAHTLGDSEERLLAEAGIMAAAPSSVYNIFSNADFPYPTVTLGDGREVRLDAAGFSLHRAVPNRADREKVMAAFFGALGEYRGTFGTTLASQVQSDVFYAKARRYDSALEASLGGPNIPTTVYSRLVEGVNKHLPTFHRYLKLRKRMMGVNELHYYDLYAPLVSSVDLSYDVEEAKKIILAAIAPLGDEYRTALERAFGERWIDMYPTPGKRSGAYSNGGAYDVHPFMLINYNGKYNDVSTLAHELGHAMQSYFSNKTQPFATANYPIFVAEVASTFNEALLIDYMLKTIKDDRVKLSLLGDYLEGIKGTVFRQTQFAEFELTIHEMAEQGQALTGEVLDKVYADITRKYYGHDQGVAVVDDYIAHEWAYIPHFYRNFYVFQYATSFTASAALSEKVLAGDQEATRRYLAFLSAGGSKYPIDLLKDAGVDMTTDEPLELTMQKMNRVIDEMERLLNAIPGGGR
jgi:oligoendopeptidase F